MCWCGVQGMVRLTSSLLPRNCLSLLQAMQNMLIENPLDASLEPFAKCIFGVPLGGWAAGTAGRCWSVCCKRGRCPAHRWPALSKKADGTVTPGVRVAF